MRAPVWLLAAWLAAAQAAPAPTGIFAEVDRIMAELTAISGLRASRRVACETLSREEVGEFLRKRVKEVATPEEIRAEEITLKKFGLAPPDFDLARTTVDLFTEQALALYDFNRRRLFVTEAVAARGQEAVLVHELAHALADQNFNLKRFIKQAGKSDDAALARMAVMEGQATWLMSEYMALRMGQSLETSPALVEAMSAPGAAAGQFPVFDAAPLYIRETLMFPYTAGMRFQHAVVKREGRGAFAAVFRRPPVSTRQVLDPEEYFKGTAPASPGLPEFPDRGYRELAAGSFGQLDHAILLEQYAGKPAAALAARLRGGRYEVREHRARRRVVLAYASEWESGAAAREFFGLYRRVLAGKWKRMAAATETPERLEGEGDDGRFVVELRGAVVTSLEGLEPATGAR